MEEAEYPGIRVTMTTLFDGVQIPLKIDISTGDVITPNTVSFNFKFMLENRSIQLQAYNLETILAEKLETVISRTTFNTRMRDFYDIVILQHLFGNVVNRKTLQTALLATSQKRGTEQQLNKAQTVFDAVENNLEMQNLWSAYRKKYFYASNISWEKVMEAVRQLFSCCME